VNASKKGKMTQLASFFFAVFLVFSDLHFPNDATCVTFTVITMDQPYPDVPAELAEPFNLGHALGQAHAFSLVAGRCTAAQAGTLCRIREEKLYKPFTSDWREFCPKFLNISASQADRIIRLWKEFGPGIFELSQLTRVSEAIYRELEPLIRDGALHFNGEAIQLDPENARKIAAIVAELRRDYMPARQKHEPTIPELLDAIEKRGEALAAEFQELASQKCQGEDLARLELALNRVAAAFEQIQMSTFVR